MRLHRYKLAISFSLGDQDMGMSFLVEPQASANYQTRSQAHGQKG